jgi:FKBP-type peptidyl-prolyl cis-trans isomerase (trigger factor)
MHDSHDHTLEQATTKVKADKEKSAMIADNLVLKLTIPWKEAHAAYKKALQKQSKKVKAEGFRKGNVPSHIAEQKIGRLNLMYDALNAVIPTKYTEAAKESKKQIIAYPDFKPVSLNWEEDWVIEAHTAEKPEIKLGNYKKIIKDAQKEADKEIKKLEKEIEKSKKEAKDKKKDDKKGAAPEMPPMTDQAKKDKTLEIVIRSLVTKVKPAVPEILIKQQAHQELHRLEDQLKQMNFTIEAYLQRRGASEESLMQELATSALAQLQTDFVLREITVQEKIEVSDKDIEKQLGEHAPKANDQMKSMVRNSLERQKLLDFLLA